MLSPRGKKELKINQRRILINSVEIGIPAPEQVFILGQRHTSNGKIVGRVRNSKTLNYKSFTPHRDGLFCERIFGPVQSYICACGKQGPLTTSKGTLKFCPRCEVEYTDQRARRYRVGYIGLVSPVTHIWHLKGRPSYLSLFLGKRKKTLATLAYCNDYLVEQAFSKVSVNGLLGSGKQHRVELSRSESYGATFFKNRILKGLKESKGIKGLTVSLTFSKQKCEQEKSKVWSPEADLIDGPSASAPRSGDPKAHTFNERTCLPDHSSGRQARTLASLELRKIKEFDKQDRKCTSFLRSLRQLELRSLLPRKIVGTEFGNRTLSRSESSSVPGKSSPKGSTLILPPSSAQVKQEVSEPPFEVTGTTFRQQKDTVSYTRSHTLPFLPTFICEFHLRDGLLSFFDTFPPSEDIPIPVYCKIPRRYPLRDVHKFMADQAFSKVQLLSPSATRTPRKFKLEFGELLPFASATQKQGGSNRTLSRSESSSVPVTPRKGHFCEAKVRGVADYGQLRLPKQKVGLINRKDVYHTSISTINEKKLLSPFRAKRADALRSRASGQPFASRKVSSVTALREVLLSLLLGRVVTTLIGLTPSLTTCLNRPESPMSKSKVLVGAKPTVVMARQVGSQLPERSSGNRNFVPVIEPVADETGTFDPPSRPTSRSARVRGVAPNKTEGFVLASKIGAPERNSNWPFRDLKKISNYGKVKRLNELLRVKRFALAKSNRLISQSPVRLLAGEGANEQSKVAVTEPTFRLSKVGGLAPFPLALLRRARTGGSRVPVRLLPTGVTPRYFVTQSKKASTNISEAIVGPAAKEAESNSLALLSNRRELSIRERYRVSTQTKSSYSKSKIVSKDLQLKHANSSWLPVIGKSPAHLTIRLVFADGWSNLGSLSKAWLANPYRSSSGYRLATDQGTAGQDPKAPLFRNDKYIRALAPEASLLRSKSATFASRKFDLRDRIGEAGNPRLKQTSNQGYFEDSFFSLRSWVRQRRTLKLSRSESYGFLGFGEGVEDWLEYWFERWLQNRYGVKRNPPLFSNWKYAPEVAQTLLSKVKSSARSSFARGKPSLASPIQIGEQVLFKQSNPILPSIGQHLCTIKGPLLLLTLRKYALGLTDQPGGNTSFFSHYQITKIKIQLFLPEQSLLGRAQLPAEHGQAEERNSDQDIIYLERFTSKLAGSEARSKVSKGQTLLRKVTKSNEAKIRSVGPKHNIACYLSKHDQKVNWIKGGVFSSNRDSALGGTTELSFGSFEGAQIRTPRAFASLTFAERKFKLELPCLDLSGPSKSSARPSSNTQSVLARRASKSNKGHKSILNLDSQIWLPKIVTIFKMIGPKRGPIVASQLNGGTSFRLGVVELERSSSSRTLSKKGPKEAQKQSLNNKKLIFTGARVLSFAEQAKDYITDPTIFSESEGQTSQSVEEALSVGTLLERTSGLRTFASRKLELRRGHLRNKAEGKLSLLESYTSLTNPRFVLAEPSWARRALERYRDIDLGVSLPRVRQLNKSASANRNVLPGTEGRIGSTFQRSALGQAPLELANQTQDAQPKPDVFFSNEDEYGDEEGPVSSIDDEPEINRVGATFAERKFGLLGSPRNNFRTDSDSEQLSKAELPRVEHNATAPVPQGRQSRHFGSEGTQGKFEFTGKVGTDSYMKAQLDLQAIQEVLSYTGGGALRELLRCFDTQAFSVILLNEIKLLREYHKGYFLYEYEQVSSKARTRDKLELPPLLLSGAEHANWNSSRNGNFREAKVRVPRIDPLKVKASLTLSRSESARDLVNTTWSSKAKEIEIDNNPPFGSTETWFRQAEYKNNYEELPEEINRFSRAIHRNARRLKIVQLLMRNKRRPEWMLISALPVLPPDLRPILQMSENLIVASDLNTLYQRVIYRNNRQYKLRIVEWSYATSLQRLVQDAVDRLIENGKGGSKPFLTPGGRPLKSLSDTLKGKKGRFRLNLLGKRVDFSGRSVIVVSPHLKIHECGLPREMALELYQYLLIRLLLLKRQVSSVILAKRVIRQQKAFVWDTLRELIYHHPLLLNRAPTLHRLGIQAFQPKLVLGSTILLHPLVCAGFNADFDGDQMGVHLPLCDEARAEAWDLLWSRNNLLSPATGEPILLPSQDMVLGFYHMTALLPSRHPNSTTQTDDSARAIVRSADKNGQRRSYGFVQIADCSAELSTPTQVRTSLLFEKGLRKSHFFSPLDVVRAYQNGDLDIHTPVWLQWKGRIENNDSNQTPLELRINSLGVSTQLYPSYKYRKDASSKSIATFNLFIRTTPGRVIVNNMFLARPD
jgi:DNA-directed RNA polymerase subunit beta'